ncbi:MAG: hypothetical protein ACRYFS_02040 [Janthinobacterium lividum]
MIYECDGCGEVLLAGVVACPKCGEVFEEAVPADAVLPRRGFSAVTAPTTPVSSDPFTPPEHSLEQALEQAEEAIKLLSGQVVILKSEVILLKNPGAPLSSEMAALSSEVTQIANRLSVVEMARREDRRRFTDHVEQVTEALQYLQHHLQRSSSDDIKELQELEQGEDR